MNRRFLAAFLAATLHGLAMLPAPALAQALPSPDVQRRPANDNANGAASRPSVDVATGVMDVARAGIPRHVIPYGSVVVSGYSAAGDAGAGARYVPGTSSGLMAIRDAGGTWFNLDISAPDIPAAWVGVVPNDPSKAAQNGASINALMAACGARGGCTIRLSPGRIYTDRTIDNRYTDVLVRGVGRPSPHDTGSAGPSTTFVPTVAGFTVVKHRSPTAAERGVAPAKNWKTSGGGFVDIGISGNGLAQRLFEVTSVNRATHRLYLENSEGGEAALYTCWPDSRVRAGQTQQLGEAGDNQHNDIDLDIRQGDTPSSLNADGVNFSGVPFNGNTSLNYGIKISVRHANGVGVRLTNADNLTFEYIREQQAGGTGKAILVQALTPGISNGQFIVDHFSGSGQAVVESLSDRAGATAVADLHILALDGGNGTPFPTGPNVVVDDLGVHYKFASLGKVFNGTAFGDSPGTAVEAKAWLAANPVFTAVFANNSNSGVAFKAGSTLYFQRIDGETGRFQFLGPTAVEFRPPVLASAGLTATSIIQSNGNAPRSSTTACTTGQQAWDANYEYRCVATNIWKRAALSSW